MNYELQAHPESLFVTLSFCDDALEEYKDNYNKAVLQFLDALRKKYGKNIRHWFVCEFGTEHGRPHYHGLLFDVPFIPFEEFESLWNRGNGKYRDIEKDDYVGFYNKPRGVIWLDRVRDTTVNYLVKYMTKEYSPNVIIPRIISSRGIGSSYLTKENIRYHNSKEKRPFYSFAKYNVALPRYYKDKIYSKEDKIALVNQLVENPPNIYFNGDVFRVGDVSLPLDVRVSEQMRYESAVRYYKMTHSLSDDNVYPTVKRKLIDHNAKLWSFAYLFPGPITQLRFNFENCKLCL